jgi:hypothetical protein
MVCCSPPSRTQRAPQLEQTARRWRLLTTVIRADAHSGQRGIRSPPGWVMDGSLTTSGSRPVRLGQLVLGAAQAFERAFEWTPLRPDRHRFSLVHRP